MRAEELERMQNASGNVQIKGRLVAFLYTLMRDVVPSGKLEAIMEDTVEDDGEVAYTNGWLARLAEDMAKRLTGVV